MHTEQTLGIQVWHIVVASNWIFQVTAALCHEVAYASEIIPWTIYNYAQIAH
jgi:hypothetical protein